MNPREQAKAVYSREFCPRTFEEDEELHKRIGYVFDMPTFFMMGRPVISTAPVSAIVNPRMRFNVPDCDCWLLYLFAGSMRDALSYEPFSLPLLAVERRNELRIYPMDVIKRRGAFFK